MTANTFRPLTPPLVMSASQWWRQLWRARELTAALSIGILAASIYAGSVVAQHIQDMFANKAGATTALYMDSIVEPLVQELVAKPSLSDDNRAALERLVSPASAGRPVIAFRVWVDDRVVLTNRAHCVGQTSPRT